ncbi:hypothetical protein AKJ51_04210 [candidate division MSBL1 archaeon SCGC-AAA382A20]|uniref:Uncharacterized protein n=1 Tax=candidate division MSBL1 archaeon SCGC-AAA382A20 TaxID=1698280 RepID=A0A133VI21_9EURY|nr:hypothetical protein AKJ51_04210 [candidate division MSBL1 archaeon SCGC-AAA382A20]
MTQHRFTHIGNMSKEEVDTKKVLAFTEMIDRPVRARQIRRKLRMPSRQVSAFFKHLDEVKRKKHGKTYQYTVDIPEIPSRIEFGDEWIKIEEVEIDGKMYKKITSSQGEEKLIF